MKNYFILFLLVGFGLGHVANGALNPVNPSQEKPAFIAIVKHHTDKIQKRVESDGTTTTSYTRVKDYNAQYQPNASDNGWEATFHGTATDENKWPDSWNKTVYNWSEMANSTYTYITNSNGTESFDPYIVESWCSHENSIVPDADLRSIGSPGYCDEIHVHWILHYYARKVKHHWDYPDGVKEEVGVNARTEMKLFTGGKSGVGRRNLICIHCTAEENGEPYAYPWAYTPTTGIDPTKLRALGQWVGNDGNLWIVLPDDANPDLNLSAPARHFDAWATVQKYKLHIEARGNDQNYDLTTKTPEFCVGQYLTFEAIWSPETPPYIDSVQHWNLPGKFVNEQHSSDTCPRYQRIDDLLTNWVTQCWYVNQPGGNVSIGPSLRFSNGQKASVAAAGSFTIYRPQMTLFTNHPPFIPMLTNGWVELGLDDYMPAGSTNFVGLMNFNATIESKTNFPGKVNWTQLNNRDVYLIPIQSTSGYELDNDRFFGGDVTVNPTNIIDFIDNPGISSAAGPYINITDQFKTYLVFKPDVAGDSIWVTLGIVTWGWSETEWWGTTMTSSHADPPTHTDSDDFPIWFDVTHSSTGE
jgi:hypothetical protein